MDPGQDLSDPTREKTTIEKVRQLQILNSDPGVSKEEKTGPTIAGSVSGTLVGGQALSLAVAVGVDNDPHLLNPFWKSQVDEN